MMLCEACGKQLAAVPIINIHAGTWSLKEGKPIREGQTTEKKLCRDCAESWENGDLEIPGLQSHVKMGCNYCGIPARYCATSAATKQQPGESIAPFAICSACGAEMLKFRDQAYGLQDVPRTDHRAAIANLTPEQREAAKEKLAGREAHMQQWRKKYAFDAYQFVRDAAKRASAEIKTRDLSGSPLLDATRLLAIERFGLGAKRMLHDLNVTTCADFREIASRLAAAESRRKGLNDKFEDLGSGYDFSTAFPEA